MLPYFSQDFGNPSGHYGAGLRAAEALDRARQEIADVLGAIPEEVVLTSGGTESINAALKGVAFAQRDAGAGSHIVTTQVEHHAVLHSAEYLERFGFDVEYLPVDGEGRVPAFEIMIGTSAVHALIRDERTHQIPATIETSAKDGMVTMDRALQNLYRKNLISRQTVLSLAKDKDII